MNLLNREKVRLAEVFAIFTTHKVSPALEDSLQVIRSLYVPYQASNDQDCRYTLIGCDACAFSLRTWSSQSRCYSASTLVRISTRQQGGLLAYRLYM